jgi:hypothetical protein
MFNRRVCLYQNLLLGARSRECVENDRETRATLANMIFKLRSIFYVPTAWVRVDSGSAVVLMLFPLYSITNAMDKRTS